MTPLAGRLARRAAARPPGANGWRASVPEVAVGISFALIATVAVYGYAGTRAAVLSLLTMAVIVLILLRLIVPAAATPTVEQERWSAGGRTSFTGFWRRHGALAGAAVSLAAYDSELRPALQHLLAARLAERHDVSLYADPETASRLAFSGSADHLWFWLDPQRPAETDPEKPGIPLRSLSAIIDRLEQL